MQIQISWLLLKPTDLDLHCLERQGVSGFSRTRLRHAKIDSFKIQMYGKEKRHHWFLMNINEMQISKNLKKNNCKYLEYFNGVFTTGLANHVVLAYICNKK